MAHRPQLSSVLAAASATGAFGIFYSSIWQMSDALSWWRLVVTGVIAGALGSSFDSSTDVRSITHGQRERQRRIEAGRTGDRHTEAAGGGEQASRA